MRRVVELFLLAIAMGLTVEIIKSAIPYLPVIWLGIFAYYTWEAMTSKYVLKRTNQIRYRLSPERHMLSYVVVAIIGAALFSLYWWSLNSFFGPRIAAYEVEQRKKEPPIAENVTDKQPTFREKIDKISFQLGERGMAFEYDVKSLGNNKIKPFNFGGCSPIAFYFENDMLYADVTIYGGTGKTPIEIVHNEFTVRKSGWDKNFNREAFEVVDDKLNPIFQLVYKTKANIVVTGIISCPGGLLLVDDDGVTVNPDLPTNFSLKRIFKYPSSKYLGQLDDTFKPRK